MTENLEDFKYSIFADRIQIKQKEPSEIWLKKVDEHLKQNPQKHLRLYWFEDEDRNKLDFLQKLKYLKGLEIDFHTDQLELIGKLKRIKKLSLIFNKKISLQPIESLSNLNQLTLSNTSKSNLELPGLKKLQEIRHLSLSGPYKNIEHINEISKLRALELDVPLENLEFLKPKGELIYLYSNRGIKDLKGIEKIESLEFLHLNYIQNLNAENLESISKMKALKGLRLDYLPHIENFHWLAGSKIEELYLISLNGLNSMNGLEKLSRLKIIATGGVFKQSSKMNLDALIKCKSLKVASLSISIAKKETYERITNQLKEMNIKLASINWTNFEPEKFL